MNDLPKQLVSVIRVSVHEGKYLHKEQTAGDLPWLSPGRAGGAPRKGVTFLFSTRPDSKNFAVAVDQHLHIIYGWESTQARGIDIHLEIIEGNGRLVGMREELAADYLIAFVIERTTQLDYIAANGSGIAGLFAVVFLQGEVTAAVECLFLQML